MLKKAKNLPQVEMGIAKSREVLRLQEE